MGSLGGGGRFGIGGARSGCGEFLGEEGKKGWELRGKLRGRVEVWEKEGGGGGAGHGGGGGRGGFRGRAGI